ncbi:hypothetical protein [Ascidiaceihabitans sp.]|uniref:hypothetical protein n=1 Tax=Ascidiaceihabitans sp. TaxID=1872644 RepID=UPI00329731C6
MKHIWAFVLLGGIVFSLLAGGATAQMFSGRPDTLSTNVTFSSHDPVSFQIIINDKQIATRRSSRLGDTGATPYTGYFDKTLNVDLRWIEVFSETAFQTSFKVPTKSLSRLDAKGEHASLTIRIGANGAVDVMTPHPELNKHLREGTEDKITPEMDVPVILKTSCASQLEAADPKTVEMKVWLDAQTLKRAKRYKADAQQTGAAIATRDRC